VALQHISCAPGAHIGEQITRQFLMAEMTTSQGILLTNYHHPAGNGTEEHDLVLINERGVWAIEVKHWFGRIDADAVYWMHAGNRHHSPVISVEKKAKSIYSALADAGFHNVSVVGLVALTRHEGRFRSEPPEEHRRKIFRLTQPLIDAVTGTDYLFNQNSQALTPTLIEKIANVLVQRKVDPERLIIGSYRLVRELEPGEGFRVYEAQHLRFENQRARVKRYQVSGYNSKAELDEAVRRFERDMRALLQLEHPSIVREIDFLPDSDSDDTCWMLTEWIEGQALADRLDDARPIAFDEQIRILKALCTALENCHSKGILHRNISPASLYLADDGSVKLGDFDFARLPAAVGKTISVTGAPLTTNKYTAPELRDSFRQADVRADLYSLGAIWYDLALRRPADEPVILARIAEAPLSKDGQDLMRMLLAPQPKKRPASAADVAEWLSLLG
jgi:hypothetical protein